MVQNLKPAWQAAPSSALARLGGRPAELYRGTPGGSPGSAACGRFATSVCGSSLLAAALVLRRGLLLRRARPKARMAEMEADLELLAAMAAAPAFTKSEDYAHPKIKFSGVQDMFKWPEVAKALGIGEEEAMDRAF
ncbi:unnamed protein product, partial [Polarella glacialis]